MKSPFHYTPCIRCGKTVGTRTSKDKEVLCKECRRKKNYNLPANSASGCTRCLWLPVCMERVKTIMPLPCQPGSGINVLPKQSHPWIVPQYATFSEIVTIGENE